MTGRDGNGPDRPLLHSTASCPLGVRCESCGREGPLLTVRTSQTPMGVLCLTLCPLCASADMAPPVSVSTAARLVIQHAMHLGIDLDQMTALIEGRSREADD